MNAKTNWFSRLFGRGTPGVTTIVPQDSGDASMDRNGRPLERLPESPDDESNPELQHLVNRINSGSRRAYIPEAAVAETARPVSGLSNESNIFHESALVQRHPWASPEDDSPTTVLSEATHLAHHELPARGQSLRSGWDDGEAGVPAEGQPEKEEASSEQGWETTAEQREPEPREPIAAEDASPSRSSNFEQYSSYREEEVEVEQQAEPETGPIGHYAPAQREWERTEQEWVYPPAAPSAAEEAYPAEGRSQASFSGGQEPGTASASHTEGEWEPQRQAWASAPPQPEAVYEPSAFEHEAAEHELNDAGLAYETPSRLWYQEAENSLVYKEASRDMEPARREPTEAEQIRLDKHPPHDLEYSATTWELAEQYPAVVEDASLEESPFAPLQEPESSHYADAADELVYKPMTGIAEEAALERNEVSGWMTHSRPDEPEAGQSISLAPDELELVSQVDPVTTAEPEGTPEKLEVLPFDPPVQQYAASFANLPDPYSDPVGARPGRLDRNPPPPRGRQPHPAGEEVATSHEPAGLASSDTDLIGAVPADTTPLSEPNSGCQSQTTAPLPARSADSMFFPPATRSQRLARRNAEAQALTRPVTEASEHVPGPPRLSRRWALLSQFGPVNGDPVVTDPSPTQRRGQYKIVDTNQRAEE